MSTPESKKYDHKAIESKWQNEWEEKEVYKVSDSVEGKENFYQLVEFSYPSGDLHTGHWYAFAVPDIHARYKRMQGFNVLYPMGFDAFGLPAENAAIKLGADPKVWTYEKMASMREQFKMMGGMFDWSREVVTCNPEYYKWTQWMFNQFLKNDLVYRAITKVNWCPKDQTILANEQVIDGKCDRCGSEIIQREQPQWMLRITKYADRLVDDLNDLNWPYAIKEAQKNWIGRSEGSEIDFKIKDSQEKITVFTTRADTLFGVTYVVLAPEHKLVEALCERSENKEEIFSYIEATKKKLELERQQSKEKTGVELKGIKAINPANSEEVPIWIADYVLAGYGTGAVMAVPAHDERDFEFAEKYNLEIRKVFEDSLEELTLIKIDKDFYKNDFKFRFNKAVFHLEESIGVDFNENQINFFIDGVEVASSKCKDSIVTFDISSRPIFIAGSKHRLRLRSNNTNISFQNNVFSIVVPRLISSYQFNGLTSEEAKKKITEFVGGKMVSTYRLRDWGISRQRYWGCPIPIVYDPEGKAYPVPEEHLPWLLPTDVDHTPDGTAPLARSKELFERTEKLFGKGWKPEVETMDTFVDSSWYFYRYLDNKNYNVFADAKKMDAWMPIDLYMGGAEHTTMHLLYSRFWTKALYDLGFVKDAEAYKVRRNRGLILGPDGNKMSKSKGNVINPDEIVDRLGADTVRMYLAFMGPYGITANYPWDPNGVVGVRRFLERVWKSKEKINNAQDNKIIHKIIKKITEDVEEHKYNTAISSMMILINEWDKQESISKQDYKILLQLLAPFAPHITEELWHQLGEAESIHLSSWPKYDEALTLEDEVTIGVQINGKLRAKITLAKDADSKDVEKMVLDLPKVKEYTQGKSIAKVIIVPNRIINIVVTG